MSLRVFVSSTIEDLGNHRTAVRDEILRLEWLPIMMDYFGVQPRLTPDACRAKVATCDLMVLVVGHRRGWEPSVDEGGDGSTSITEWEYREACHRGLPVIAFRASDRWPQELRERDSSKRERARSFLGRIGHPAQSFDYEGEDGVPRFAFMVREALARERERIASGESSEASVSAIGLRVIEILCRESKSGRSCDPMIKVAELATRLSVSEKDVAIAADELEELGLAVFHDRHGAHPDVWPQDALFWEADRQFMGWATEADARRIARVLVEIGEAGLKIAELANQLGWTPRRLNPAATYLADLRGAAEAGRVAMTRDYVYYYLRANMRTERFLRQG